ncbi:glycosyltransferase family 4 protein [Acinetobacter towneri]|uniref:glycosyltransferase family 4 protein n=1 Tax=Acinetobacter towneri TaxID=202956 RepID=UPI0025771718|nr:glycosyltransferase family 4 protein [Acinetobacter towneri]MDM1283394.1 glycosyltransferase family 4 protein [Acinetobacter towneri]
MKVCLIVPTLKQGGAERVISELASQFSQQGVEVHLILLAKAEDFYSIDCNVTIHRLGFVNKGRVQKIFSEIKTFFKLRGLLKEHKPDAVLSFMDKFNVFTILASRFLNLRVFVSDRSNPKLKLRPSLYVLKKLTYRYATGIIAQTTLAKEVIEKLTGNKNVQVIPNPLKKVQLYPGTPREKIILNVGRLVPEKGQQYLLQAFARLQGDDWKLVILGDGPLRDNLETQIINLNLSDKVEMLGAVTDIDEWLAKASIFAFSSVSEGFPNALVEGMAAGLACVSFDCDAGPRDIIKHGVNGFLVQEKNIGDLAEKMYILIKDPILLGEFGTNAKVVRDKYNIESICRDYINFLSGNQNRND